MLGQLSIEPTWTMFLLLIWTITIKGIALWKASKNNSKYWFIVLLIINTFGILELLYIFIISKNKLFKFNFKKIKK